MLRLLLFLFHSERMNGIPSISINIHTSWTEYYEDSQIDILNGLVDKVKSPEIEVKLEVI